MTAKAHARFVVLFGVVTGAFAALAPACSLDWQVRPDPGDGELPDTSRADVAVADTGLDTTVVDAPDDSAAECAALKAAVDAAKTNAKKCTLGVTGQCTTTVNDECGCPLTVRAAGSAQNSAYADAIAAFLTTCKPVACPSPCVDLGPSGAWACLAPPSSGTCKPD